MVERVNPEYSLDKESHHAPYGRNSESRIYIMHQVKLPSNKIMIKLDHAIFPSFQNGYMCLVMFF